MAAEQPPISPIHEFAHEIARAKVNLYLHVTGRREDGYHLLDSLVMFADVGDQITIAPSNTLTLTQAGPFGNALPDPSENLVMRAAIALQDLHDIEAGAHITLTKNLPVASGIGGGSADAAAALRGLCQLWGIDPSSDAVLDLALSLGADVPVCLRGRSTIMRGIGESFTDIQDCPPTPAVLVNPGVGVSTPTVFKARTGDFSPGIDWDAGRGTTLAERLGHTRNDLEPPAISLSPVIDDVLSALTDLEGVQLARMSGSGATCFGLFANTEAAQAGAARLRSDHPDWWATATIFGP
jgi:4-diphosphocytidyl-2-C-methyl-D-erythritol kinase